MVKINLHLKGFVGYQTTLFIIGGQEIQYYAPPDLLFDLQVALKIIYTIVD